MNYEGIRVLVVDDEPDILEILSYTLSKEGFYVKTAVNGEDGWVMAENFNPELYILDIMMPRLNGIELCKKLRNDERFNSKMITFLTAKSGDEAEIEAFEAGADDFITKPIKPKVLVSRVQAILKRSDIMKSENKNNLQLGDLRIDLEKYEVSVADRKVDLARKEFELLKLLVSKPGKVFSRQEILAKIWGQDVIVVDRTVDVHIRKLRSKLGDDYIKTLKGIGYKFNF